MCERKNVCVKGKIKLRPFAFDNFGIVLFIFDILCSNFCFRQIFLYSNFYISMFYLFDRLLSIILKSVFDIFAFDILLSIILETIFSIFDGFVFDFCFQLFKNRYFFVQLFALDNFKINVRYFAFDLLNFDIFYIF